MVKTNTQPVFRVQFAVSARKLRNEHDREGQEIPDSRQQVTKDFFNPAIPQAGQQVRLLATDELKIEECHFDLDRDLWLVKCAEVKIRALSEQEARQDLEEWLRQLADGGWTTSSHTGGTGATEIVEIRPSQEEDYGDTELAGP